MPDSTHLLHYPRPLCQGSLAYNDLPYRNTTPGQLDEKGFCGQGLLRRQDARACSLAMGHELRCNR